MIFYFSGSGNSYHAAKVMAEGLGDRMVDLAKAQREQSFSYTLQKGEKLGFIFPVHAWAPPLVVEQFIRQLELYYEGELYTYAVCTCGQSAGETMAILEAALRENGLTLDSGYSVIMPDNYAVLFRAPSEAQQAQLLQQADETLSLILRAVKLERQDFFRVKKGKGSALLSNLINPLFRRFATKTKKFYPTVDCIGCGICAKVCTAGCITMTAGVPFWEEVHCHMCMSCLQHCPQEAIQYGRSTANKGRYLHPDYRA